MKASNDSDLPIEKAPSAANFDALRSDLTKDPDVRMYLALQSMRGLSTAGLEDGTELAKLIETPLKLLSNMGAADTVELVLSTQFLACHNAAAECLGKALSPGYDVRVIDMYFRHAEKLFNLSVRIAEVINKKRGNARTQVNVGSVTVASGGQAVVGSVETKAASARD